MPEQYTSENEKQLLSKNKRNRFVNKSIAEFINPATGLVSKESVTDNFRSDVMNYWKWNDVAGAVTYNTPLQMSQTPEYAVNDSKKKIMKFLSADLGAKVSLRKIQQTIDNNIPGQIEELYEVYINGTDAEIAQTSPFVAEAPVTWWRDWCLSKFSNGAMNEDIVFSMNRPETKTLNEETSFFERNFVKIKGNYNYLKLGYEKLISGLRDDVLDDDPEVFNEKVLPNLYTYMSVVSVNNKIISANKNQKNANPNPTKIIGKFKNHLTLNGLLEDFDTESLFYKETKNDKEPFTYNRFDLANNSISNYLDLWTDAAAFRNKMHMNADSFLEEAQAGYSEILFSEADFNIINNYNSAASMFPMNIQIQIEPEQNKSVFRALKATKYNPFMLRYIATSEGSLGFDSLSSNEEITEDTPLTSLPFSDFLEQAKNGDLALDPGLKKDYVYIGSANDEYDFEAPQNSLFTKLMSLGLESKMNSLINSTSRTWEDILQGDECYEETVVYEVEKWTAGGGGQLLNKVQTFYLPNDDTDMIEMFDTQVKYNKFYVYRIYAHKVVFGTQYQYNLGEASISVTPSKKSALLTVTTSPSIKIIRVPYYNVDQFGLDITGPGTGVFSLPSHNTTIVIDEAPLPPEIEFVPYIKTPSTLLINLKDTIGTMKQLYRPIEEQDVEQYQVLLENQLKNDYNLSKEELAEIDIFNNEVFFKSEEPSQYLQIFQTVIKPTSYSDFQDSEKQLLNGPNNSVKVDLNFNQKYYFTFRAIDYHGKFSNPTDVYEVEIKEEDNFAYPVIRIFNIEEETKADLLKKKEQETNFSTKGKKYIHIKPAYHQWIMKEKYVEEDYDSAFDIPDFEIGEAEESVFRKDRRFKIRLTSKKTGRKIDLNVKFKQRQEKLY
tara:strand:+ start:6648 stop:9314 length:2667 start_codon:yes stop_codon:yes gene_type:complete